MQPANRAQHSTARRQSHARRATQASAPRQLETYSSHMAAPGREHPAGAATVSLPHGPAPASDAVVPPETPHATVPPARLALVAQPIREATTPTTPRKPYRLAHIASQVGRTVVQVSNARFGAGRPVIIGGPCSVETEEQIVATAHAVRNAGGQVLRGGAFKPRTSPYAFSGLGEEGLKLLALARAATGLPVVTEVMEPGDVELVGRYADMLQIGSRNMQNYPLLRAVGRSRLPVLLKRGLAATIEEWLLAAEYILAEGNDQVVLCERGVRGFDTTLRNQLDLSAVPLLRELTHLPVIVDPSHATGKRSLILPISLAAVAAGADGLIIEVHPDPDRAVSDAAQTVDFAQFSTIATAVFGVAAATAAYYPSL